MKNALSLKIGRVLNDYKALPGLQPHYWNRWFTLAFPFSVHQPQCLKWRHLSHPRNHTLRNKAQIRFQEFKRVKESQVLLQKDSGGKAKELLPLMPGPIPALYQDKGTEEESCSVPQATQGSAVWAHQAGFAEGLIYLTYRARRLSLVLPWYENEVHKSELFHLLEKRCAGSVHGSRLWALAVVLEFTTAPILNNICSSWSLLGTIEYVGLFLETLPLSWGDSILDFHGHLMCIQTSHHRTLL